MSALNTFWRTGKVGARLCCRNIEASARGTLEYSKRLISEEHGKGKIRTNVKK